MDTESTICTDFLTSKSSYLSGMGTVLNIGGNYYEFNYSKTTEEADKRAIEHDWKMIGQDFRSVLKNIIRW